MATKHHGKSRCHERKEKASCSVPYQYSVLCFLNEEPCVCILPWALQVAQLAVLTAISSSAPGQPMQTLEGLGALVWPQWSSCLWKMELQILETMVPSLPAVVLWAPRLALPGPRGNRTNASPCLPLRIVKIREANNRPRMSSYI